MGLRQKIQWRLKLLGKALYVWPEADWIGVFKEIISSHDKAKSHPQPRLLDRDGDLGFYQVSTRRLFSPLAFDPSFLGFVYEEVFARRTRAHGECRICPVDAGACGFFLPLPLRLRKGANVLAFEPVPEVAKALGKTLAEFIEAGRAKVFPFALGKENSVKTLHIYSYNVGGSTTSKETLNVRRNGANAVHREKVRVTSLDSLLSETLPPPISFIKADVGGFERELLLGAQEVILRYSPCLPICAYHLPDDWRAISEIVRGFGVGYKVKFKDWRDISCVREKQTQNQYCEGRD